MRIFLSHASESKGRVKAICSHLPAHVAIWLDQERLFAGSELTPEIQEAIEVECDFVVVFLDRYSVVAPWVKRETEISLRRQVDLGRPFLLPVLLDDCRSQLNEVGLDVFGRVYLNLFEIPRFSARRAAGLLSSALFAHVSEAIEQLRSQGRRSILGDFSRASEIFKNSALMWVGVLQEELIVLSRNQAAFDHLGETVRAYNRVAEPYLVELPGRRDKIIAAWKGHRGLCIAVRELVEWIEAIVIRRALFGLNDIHAMIHRLSIDNSFTTEQLEAMETSRRHIVLEAKSALDELTSRSARLITNFELEI